jgi:hypothetical protein
MHFHARLHQHQAQRLPTLAGIVAHVAALDEERGIVWLRKRRRLAPDLAGNCKRKICRTMRGPSTIRQFGQPFDISVGKSSHSVRKLHRLGDASNAHRTGLIEIK